MKISPAIALFPFFIFPALAVGQPAQPVKVLRDLEPLQPHILSKDELQQLLPGAAIRRINEKGNTHAWTNDTDGSFVVSSDNRSTTGRNATARGKWHLSDDGRYCILIDWNRADNEEWCRLIIKTSDGYYTTKSDRMGTEKVYKLDIVAK
ncbi:hypothetical protein [Polaromonas sp.]|uniref:hypothetical protein n=1 Tax=Polaromonas sp. TaxID=1869339 RepID=UPI0013B7CFD9|nr:hypothetical protein [Polaromonas sp.]NDP64040.1 hypothetical protein [Polaromonas sp.]